MFFDDADAARWIAPIGRAPDMDDIVGRQFVRSGRPAGVTRYWIGVAGADAIDSQAAGIQTTARSASRQRRAP